MSSPIVVEFIEQRRDLLAVHYQWMNEIKTRLSESGIPEDEPQFVRLQGRLEAVCRIRSRTDEIVKNPKGHHVVIKKSRKLPPNTVGFCKYTSLDRNYASVALADGRTMAVSLSQVEPIDLPPLPMWIPAPGMQVRRNGKEGTYIALDWLYSAVFLVSTLPNSSPFWIERLEVTDINGIPTYHGVVI